MEALAGLVGVYCGCAALHVAIPAIDTEGYACDRRGVPLQYRLNGLRVLAAMLAIMAAAVPWTVFYENFFAMLLWANGVGIAGSYIFYQKGKGKEEMAGRCLTKDSPTPVAPTAAQRKAFAAETTFNKFYLGLEFNPRYDTGVPGVAADFDWKMFLYLVGAVMLELIVCSTAAAHAEANAGVISNAMITGVCLWTWFIVEYIYHEHVHLFTYDLFAEKLGAKLTWGCFVFYPFFYALGLRCMVTEFEPGQDLSVSTCAGIVALFLTGWSFTRGANNQKYTFKVDPDAKFLGILEPRYLEVPASAAGKAPRRILISGWWGLARHVNYMGEIIQGVAFGLPGLLSTGSAVPLLYPVFITSLMVTREIDDAVICEAKYGDTWQKYKSMVPYRIIPGLY